MKVTKLYSLINDMHSALPKRFGNGFAFPPLRVGCVLSHRCNLRCSMCFVWKRGAKSLQTGELTTEEWLGIIQQIPKQAIVTFTGGEPLIRKDLVQLLKAACSKHRVHLVSNGTLFDDELIELALNLAPSGLFGKGLLSLGVSLEGPPEIHDAMVKVPGAYEKTTRTLAKFAELKRSKGIKYPLLDLKIVICKETQGNMIRLYDLAEELGLDIISFQQCSTQESSYGIDDAPDDAMFKAPPPVEPIPREELLSEMKELQERAKSGKTDLRFNPEMPLELFGDRYENKFPLKEFTCSAAWSIMHIGPYGTVYPCFSIPMGSLKERSLNDIWNGPEYRDFRKKLKKANIFPGCTGCCVMKRKS